MADEACVSGCSPTKRCSFFVIRISIGRTAAAISAQATIELWALKHVKGICQAIPRKSLCSMGSKGCAASEYYGVGCQGVLDCVVQGLGDNELPVIVVDLYLVETL